MHKVYKKQVYRIGKGLFFLRPFYVLSTSFLRNGYMEVRKVHKLYIFGGEYLYLHIPNLYLQREKKDVFTKSF